MAMRDIFKPPCYVPSREAAWLHYLCGHIPDHQYDFIVTPQLDNKHRITSQLKLFTQHLSPRSDGTPAVAIYSIQDSRSTSPDLALACAFRMRNLQEHVGRGSPQFAHCITPNVCNIKFDKPDVILMDFVNQIKNNFEDFYRNYYQNGWKAGEMLIPDYLRQFRDLSRVTRQQSQSIEYKSISARAFSRLFVVYRDSMNLSNKIAAATKLTKILYSSNLIWGSVTIDAFTAESLAFESSHFEFHFVAESEFNFQSRLTPFDRIVKFPAWDGPFIIPFLGLQKYHPGAVSISTPELPDKLRPVPSVIGEQVEPLSCQTEPILRDSDPLEQALSQCNLGWFAVEAPHTLQLDEAVIVSASALRDIAKQMILASTLHQEQRTIEIIKMSRILRVELVADRPMDFDIVPYSLAEQPVFAGEITLWEWLVAPKRIGKRQVLRILATSLLDISGTRLGKSHPVKTIEVEVTVNAQNHNYSFGISRASVRKFLTQSLKDDSALNAFCLDYFNEVYNRFAIGMNRIDKLNLLIQENEPDTIMAALRMIQPSLGVRRPRE